MKTIFASLSLALVACGGSPLDAGSGDSAGSGTQTLTVEGSAIAHPNVANSGTPTDFTTDFSIHVQLGQTNVTTGTVTLTSKYSTVNLTLNNNNRWEGAANGYDEVYQLDVTSGPDTIAGVRVDGPDIHTISAPTAGASIDSSIVNMLTWNREITADTVRLRVTDGGNDLTIADSGTFSIPATTFRAERDKTRAATIQLTRSNQISPAGAAAGSTFSVGIEQELDVVVQACTICP